MVATTSDFSHATYHSGHMASVYAEHRHVRLAMYVLSVSALLLLCVS